MAITVTAGANCTLEGVRASLLVAVLALALACAPGPSATAPWRAIACDSAVGSPANASDVPAFGTAGWKTDFARHCVPLSEITSGGPPRDGIPPLDRPTFDEAALADTWLEPQEPVIVVAEANEARAYPLQILIWHEIVNDTLAGRPVVVTFCPLCNTSLVYDRRVGGRELTFGTTGDLRYSDLVMWDRQTESWWQQATGEAIVGELTAMRLARVPSVVLSYEEFKRARTHMALCSRATARPRRPARKQGRDVAMAKTRTSVTTAPTRRRSRASSAIALSMLGCLRRHASESPRSRPRPSPTGWTTFGPRPP